MITSPERPVFNMSHRASETLGLTKMSELTLYNTLARARKRCFVPMILQRITMYVCGPTVYNYAHIGNARPVVVFDCLSDSEAQYPTVVYARNITDIDDKIIQAALERSCGIETVSEEFTAKYREDMAAAGCPDPND